MRRRHGRTRLRLVADERGPLDGRARVGAKDRDDVRALLSDANRAGCFGATDAYERHLEALDACNTASELAALVADVEDLVPEALRHVLLRVLRTAHVDGRLGFEEFEDRTTRCLGALHANEADAMVRDLGHRVVRAPPKRVMRGLRSVSSVIGVPALAGAAMGGTVAAVPAALSVPGATAQWVPLAVACGVFSAVATGVASAAWRLRRRGGAAWPSPGLPGRRVDDDAGPDR